MRAYTLTLTAFALALTACGGGSSSPSSSSTSGFEIIGINVQSGQVWEINRALRITFSQDVDFSTVNFNTVSILDSQGFGATGYFYQDSPNEVVFQPSCPTLADFSDAGLRPARQYRLDVKGDAGFGVTVCSGAGEPLENGESCSFQTPDSEEALDLFVDTVPGPPSVLILPSRLGAGELVPADTAATYVEIGGERRFFGRDESTQEGRLEPGLDLPLNHYSLPENQVVFFVQINQAVQPGAENLDLLTLEYADVVHGWTPVAAAVQLAANCTATGALAEVRPLGILPQGSELRLVLRAGFADLTGDQATVNADNFAMVETLLAGMSNPLFPFVGSPQADETLETFVLDADSFEDKTAIFPVPSAHWGDGRLQAAFAFSGTGGPGGDFDWHIPPATEIILDTTSDVIFGGPGGAQTGSNPVINGLVNVRNLLIPPTSKLVIVGPNTCTIQASGTVRVQGTISVQGSDNPGVGTLNTTNQPEVGALGQAGGGNGGDGSPLTTASSPRGESGNGAFQAPNTGGEGGETSYQQIHPNDRRGAGGGGGVLGHEVRYDHDGNPATPRVRPQTLVGLDAEYGNAGQPTARGAENQDTYAQGGLIGASPFVDESADNDFLGTKLTEDGVMIRGELEDLYAGAGGGGGGDSSNTDSYPQTPFNPTGDEKGAGGGGGAGGLRILAIGPIIVGQENQAGQIILDGGTGGGGENAGGGWGRIGGGSGGGSGGHLVMSSAASITIYGRAESGKPWYGDDANLYHSIRAISALGGQGGAGKTDRGGAKANGAVPWNCDRIPFDYFDGFTDVPPFNDVCFNALPDIALPEGPCIGAGGDGGPGLVQLHVETLDSIIFPDIEAEFPGTSYGNGLDVTFAMAPPPEGWKSPTEAPDQMIPFFGRLSMAQSRWIPLGLARINEVGSSEPVHLRGISGIVPHGAGETVELEDPIVGPEVLGALGFIVSMDASALAPENGRYAENPALLRRASLRLEDSLDADISQLYTVLSASYDDATERFELHLDPNGPNPSEFSATGETLATLVPHTVRVVTEGVLDSYPDKSNIVLQYDATIWDTVLGIPSEDLSYSAQNGDLTEDLDDLNSSDQWDFVRFKVIFDLDALETGVDLSTPKPGLDSLRLQFEF